MDVNTNNVIKIIETKQLNAMNIETLPEQIFTRVPPEERMEGEQPRNR